MKKYRATLTIYIEAENPHIADKICDQLFGDRLDILEPVAFDVVEVKKIPNNRRTYQEG